MQCRYITHYAHIYLHAFHRSKLRRNFFCGILHAMKLVELMLTFHYLFADSLVCVVVCYIKWLDIQKHLYYVHCNGYDFVYTS